MLQASRIISRDIGHFQMTGQIVHDLAHCVTLEFYAKHAELFKN